MEKNETQNPSGEQPDGSVEQTGRKEENLIGIAGFTLALCALFFFWVPTVQGILSMIAFVVSFIGLFKKPPGLAFFGMIISVVGGFLL